VFYAFVLVRLLTVSKIVRGIHKPEELQTDTCIPERCMAEWTLSAKYKLQMRY